MKVGWENRRLGILVFVCALVLIGFTARADTPQTQPSNPFTLAPDLASEAGDLPGNPDSINADLEEAASRPAGLLKHGPVSLLDPLIKKFNQTTEDFGLNVGISYTIVYQIASGGPGDRDAAGGDFDLFGSWRLLGKKDDPYRGALYFSAENRHQVFTPIPPASLGTEIGSLWGTTNGFNEQVFTLKEVYWQQHFANDFVLVRVGKIDAENYYDSNYWQSDSKYFLMKTFSSFPVRAFPSNGLGMNLTVKLSDLFYVSTGFQDAQGKKTTSGFDTFFEDFNTFSAAEFGVTPTIKGVGKGTYRFTAWYRDAGESNGVPHDAGFDMSIDQHVGEHWIPFFRYGIGEGNINGIDNMISTGVGWEGKLITKSDVVGIAGTWGQPSNHDQNDQYGAEVFYRLQVSPDNQFTVGYQLFIDPVNQPDEHVVGVFELRWRIAM